MRSRRGGRGLCYVGPAWRGPWGRRTVLLCPAQVTRPLLGCWGASGINEGILKRQVEGTVRTTAVSEEKEQKNQGKVECCKANVFLNMNMSGKHNKSANIPLSCHHPSPQEEIPPQK